MRIGYCSPFNPCQSGVSDFSEELIGELRKHVELVLFSPQKPSNTQITNFFEWHLIKELENDEIRNKLDLIVYHVGNHVTFHEEIVAMLMKYPGIMELHDLCIHNLIAGLTIAVHGDAGRDEYCAIVKYCHGEKGMRAIESYLQGKDEMPWNKYSLEMTMNKFLVDKSLGVIVHSDMAKQMILATMKDKQMPIVNIPLHSIVKDHGEDGNMQKCRKKLHLPENKIIMGSFGLATRTKRVVQILEALQRYKQQYGDGFMYCIVGSTAEDLNLQERIKKMNLQMQVRITGYVSLEEFEMYMEACDFCFNLRYPTQGESSAALHRMLGLGKPAIVTAIGTFLEYPDNIVRKVRYDEHEVEDITQQIIDLTSDREQLTELGECARKYAEKNCSLEKNAEKYACFFKRVHDHTYEPEWMDRLVDVVMELGLVNEQYTDHLNSIVTSMMRE